MIVLLLLLFLSHKLQYLKAVFTYIFIALFAFTFSYKSVKYLFLAKADIICTSDIDCENEKEDSIEKDEIIDPFCNILTQYNKFILTEEIFLPTELVVDFHSNEYRNLIYSPPEILS